MTRPILLEAENISKSYATSGFGRDLRRVLSDVSLALAQGDCLGLIGRSGSGKSTLARLLMGFERPTGGSVRFRGTPLAGMDRAARRAFRQQVQIVFQDSVGAVDPRQRIGAAVEEPLRFLTPLDARARAARVAEVLAMVGLPADTATRLPGQLSGGQLQRVCIARALAPRPQVIVLDEAVSNLDLTLQVQVLDMLAGFRRDLGTSFVFVTHDLRLVRRFCNRVAVLAGGRVVENRAVTPGPFGFTHPEALALEAAILPARPPALTLL